MVAAKKKATAKRSRKKPDLEPKLWLDEDFWPFVAACYLLAAGFFLLAFSMPAPMTYWDYGPLPGDMCIGNHCYWGPTVPLPEQVSA